MKENYPTLENGEFYIFSVKDILTGKFMQPTYGEDVDAMIRIFTYQINNNPIWKDNASDYQLYKIGLFSEKSGMIIPEMDLIIDGHAVRKE